MHKRRAIMIPIMHHHRTTPCRAPYSAERRRSILLWHISPTPAKRDVYMDMDVMCVCVCCCCCCYYVTMMMDNAIMGVVGMCVVVVVVSWCGVHTAPHHHHLFCQHNSAQHTPTSAADFSVIACILFVAASKTNSDI